MGVAYYPEFERKISGYDPSVSVAGKSVASAKKRLDEISKRLKVSPFFSFYSESNKEAFEKIGELMPPDMQDEPIRWSKPEDGVKTVSALIGYLKDHPGEVDDSDRICEDLESFRKVFLKAQKHKTRFRLRIDI
jgi:hypothetical protein